MEELRERVAVVTGAASGIGRALCERFAAEGMHVVMADVDPERLQQSADAVAADSGAEVIAVPTDAAQWESVEELARRAVERFGAVHVLCNNAGVQRPTKAWECTLEDWSWLVGVNLNGVFYGIKAFVPAMVARAEPGHVVNTASVGGLLAYPELAPYAATKYGVVGMSESLHHDLRQEGVPIGVSVLCPGAVATQFRAHSRALRPGGAVDEIGDISTPVAIPPSDVARQVLDAIRTDRFWIVTHPTYHEFIERRCRGIVETDEVVVPGLV